MSERAGVARANEPVRLRFGLDSRARALGAIRLWNQTSERDETAQAENTGDPRTGQILLLCTQRAKSEVRYRLYYGREQSATMPGAMLKVTGEDLAWTVENRHMVVDLRKNPGTGRNGQINTILLKAPPVLLTRNRPTSSLHLSPNAAAGPQWAGINRWDPPKKYAASGGPLSFRLEREGEMPNVPGLYVKTSYEFFAEAPFIAVDESIEAQQDAQVRILRLNEWSFAPGPENPFTHMAWEDAAGRVSVKPKEKEETLPLETRWLAFISAPKRFGFASVTGSFSTSEAPILRNQAARFAGDPHYFYRILIQPEGDSLISIPRGTRYATRYWIYCFSTEGSGYSTELVSRFCRSVQHPLRTRVGRTGRSRLPGDLQ